MNVEKRMEFVRMEESDVLLSLCAYHVPTPRQENVVSLGMCVDKPTIFVCIEYLTFICYISSIQHAQKLLKSIFSIGRYDGIQAKVKHKLNDIIILLVRLWSCDRRGESLFVVSDKLQWFIELTRVLNHLIIESCFIEYTWYEVNLVFIRSFVIDSCE